MNTLRILFIFATLLQNIKLVPDIKKILLVTFFLFSIIPLHAQRDYFSIQGVVTNTEGEELIGATVLVHELHKGTMTDVNGEYKISGLRRGTYHLHVTSVGYEAVTKTVNLRSDNAVEDFTLHPSLLELKEIFVEANPFKSGPLEQSMTIESVDRDFIERSSSNTFVNALQRIPGISSINTGVGISKPVIRGMSFNRVIVNDRGVKQEGQQWGADHGLEIDQYEPERVEIVKGPSSLLYGSDGIAGVINIQPPPLPDKNTLSGTTLAAFKSNNDLFGTSTMVQGNKEGKVFRLRFSTQDFGDYKVPADNFTYNRFVLPIYNQTLKNTAGRERNFSAMIGTNNDWGYTTLTVSNFHQKAGLFPGAMGFPRAFQLTDDGDSRSIDIPRQITDHFKAIVNTNILFKQNWLEMDFGYQRNFRREESNPHAHGKGPRPEGILALGLDLQTISGNLRYHHAGNGKLSSIYGMQLQYQENQKSGFEFLLPDFRSGNMGVYTYQELTLNNIATVNGGIRFDHGYRNIAEFSEPIYNDNETIVYYFPRVKSFNRQFSNISGATGISFNPHHNFNAKLNLGSSFRMPSAPELSSNGMHHGTFRYEIGDSTLNSERGYQVDLNLTYHTRDFHFSITPFYNFFNQFIYLGPTAQFPPEIQLPSGEVITNPGGQAYQYQQNDAIFTGAEASIEYHIFKELHLRSAVEYVWNVNLNTQLGLPFTPPFSILNEVTYEVPVKSKLISNLNLGILAQTFSAQNRVDRNEKRTPGYTLVNFESGFDLTIKNTPVNFIFTVQNLTNKVYFNHLSRYRLINLPEQGRNFTVMVKVPFNIPAFN